MERDIHTMPIGDLVVHDARRDCWCAPMLERTCPECEGEAHDGCWRCGGEGAVEADHDHDEPCVVLHNARR